MGKDITLHNALAKPDLPLTLFHPIRLTNQLIVAICESNPALEWEAKYTSPIHMVGLQPVQPVASAAAQRRIELALNSSGVSFRYNTVYSTQ